MNRLFNAKPLLAVAVAFGAMAAASAAHARSDVILSIGVQAPFGYVQPAPVYVQPQPVYVQPRPVYVQPQPVYTQPQVVYYGSQHRPYWHRGDWRDADRDSRFHDARFAHRAGPWGDADGDGVPNRYDRAPNNPYRR